MTTQGHVVVAGAGNWGTTLAALYASARPTVLWTRDESRADTLLREGENRRYLPGVPLPRQLEIEPLGGRSLGREDILVMAVPSHQVGAVLPDLAHVVGGAVVVNAAKGFDVDRLRTLSEGIEEALPGRDVLALSGPNIAREIAEGKPAKAVLAGRNHAALRRALPVLTHDRFRLEPSLDRRGVELCAALKGMLAIAVGLVDGYHMGDNAAGLVIARGLAEFSDLATAMGASRHTVYGIAGLGDMVTSGLSPHGRNRRFGRLLAKGMDAEEALAKVGMVVEGVRMLGTVVRLERWHRSLPLLRTVQRIVDGIEVDPRRALLAVLMAGESAGGGESRLHDRGVDTASFGATA